MRMILLLLLLRLQPNIPFFSQIPIEQIRTGGIRLGKSFLFGFTFENENVHNLRSILTK